MTRTSDLAECAAALQVASEALLAVSRQFQAALAVEPAPAPVPLVDATIGQLLTPMEVCDRLHLAKSTVYRLITDGKLPTVRIGRAVRIREADLATWAGAVREPEMEIRQPVTRFGRPVALPKQVAR